MEQATTAAHIESFEQACKKLGHDPESILPDVSKFPEKHQKAITAHAKMIIIAEAENDGHQFDWNDWSERKWFPWFDLEVTDENPSGFRFIAAYYDRTSTYTTGGSRLCFRTQAAAEHAGKKFLDLYKDMMVVPK
jgi:hypothetical protein